MSKSIETDVLIIGAGISGLAAAALLERQGIGYRVVDSQDEVGGLTRTLNNGGFVFDFGMKSVPIGSNIHENPLLQLKEKLGLNYGLEPWTESALTLEKGELRPFLGFGERLQTTEADELSYYAQSPRLMVSGGFGKLIFELLSVIPEKKILLKKRVTALRADDERITGAVLNNDEIVVAKKIVSTLAPSHLAKLLPADLISQRTLQRLTQREPFAVLSLDIATEKRFFGGKNMIFLSEDNEDPMHMAGLFVTNIDPLRAQHQWQVSSWMTLIPQELVANDEEVSKIIRAMKRLVNRAFPSLIENKKWERIMAIDAALGFAPSLNLESNQTLPGTENLYMAGAGVRARSGSSARNTAAAIESALSLAEILGSEILNITSSTEASAQLGQGAEAKTQSDHSI